MVLGQAGARPPPAMWLLRVLGLVLSCQGTGAFVMQVSSSCLLAANGSVPAFGLSLLFDRTPLACFVPQAQLFLPCAQGALQGVDSVVASLLNADPAWGHRAQSRLRACQELGTELWGSTARRSVPPQLRIVADPLPTTPGGVLLTCYVWGFYPPEVTVTWMLNGDPVATAGTAKVLPRGDFTYQTQATLRASAQPGDSFSCSVQHRSLQQPLRQHWGPGLSPELLVKVVVAVAIMGLGLVVFSAGTFCYCQGGVSGTVTNGGEPEPPPRCLPAPAAASESQSGNW
ncbi:HLA class II histocompatibility antigen, DM beta chain-like [Dryobates pubescens]|uniref:HLA class II histocompatibility antigen, DM beta chain-like n=1 Tax=Dryobates pubescens TaxID=118200 RepID=UPI0023BA241C|nr:HLA class II histocompatibility antigen, DM beta chain-like [Dryobates pubescens]